MLRHLFAAILLLPISTHGASTDRPDWAFFQPSADSARLVTPSITDATHWTAPGSHKTYALSELGNAFDPPDWYPDEHGSMPDVVAHGSPPAQGKPPLLPCALCHLPNGAGHVESASLAGLSADYIQRQFVDWQSGARKIEVGNADTMAFLTALKRRYTADQVQSAARYFAALEPRAWIRVVEATRVPVSAVDPQTLMRLPLHGTEPIGARIVELPESPIGLLYRDSHSGYVAYVPKGSVSAGRVLVSGQGDSRVPACASCHGPGLAGLANAPPIAGRPPTYMVRQLWSFRSGARAGALAAPMQAICAILTPAQMLSIAAYLASCPPK